MARDVRIAIVGDATQFSRAVARAQGDASKLEGSLTRAGNGFKSLAKHAAVGAAGLAVAGVALGKGLLDAAVESQKVTAQTEAVIKSMGGASKVSAKQVADLSTALSLKSGVDDELIQSGSNVLLTFGNIRDEVGKGRDIFSRANEAALDMSVALGTDMKSSAMQVGKALNDPIKGLAKLSRSGVQFTKQQEAQIKAMVKAGDVAGAQGVMLGELERQFGGSAAAQATAGDRLKVAWGNVQEELGTKLLPVVERVSTWLAENLPDAIATTSAWFKDNLQPAIEAVGRWMRDDLAPAIKSAWAWFNEHLQPAIRDTAIWIRDHLVPAVITVVGWIARELIPAVGNVAGKFGEWIGKAIEVASGIKEKFNEIVTFIGGLPTQIAEKAKGMWDGIKDAFKDVINWIIRGWNSLEFKIPGFDPPGPGPKFGGFTLGVPDIPQLARGGIIDRPTLAMLGDGTGLNRREIATPERLLRDIVREEGTRGDLQVTQNFYGSIGRSTIADAVHELRKVRLEAAA